MSRSKGLLGAITAAGVCFLAAMPQPAAAATASSVAPRAHAAPAGVARLGASPAATAPVTVTQHSRVIGPGLQGSPLPASTRVPAPGAAAPTRSARPSVAQPATATSSPQVLNDTGFETGSPGCCWGQSSSGGGYPLITTFYSDTEASLGNPGTDPDGGSYSADLCGYLNCNPDKVSQGFTVPANVKSATLNYYITLACPASSTQCQPGSDLGIVGVSDAGGSTVQNVYEATATPGFIYPYQTDSVDATAFLQARTGQFLQVFTAGITAGGDKTRWFMDRVTLTLGIAPDAPTGVSASNAGPGQAMVSWTPPSYQGTSAVTGYTVSTYNAKRQFVSSTVVTSSPATISGLTNGSPYFFTVAANNSAGTGPAAQSNSVTPVAGTTPPARMTAPSTSQYTLPNSDGSTWQVLDESNLSLSIATVGAEDVLLSANADLWTWNAGYNQDIGIAVNGTVVAWKESGGFAGTFSPNAAFVETVYHMSASTTYSVEVVWKTNKSAIGASISAGAGPINTAFSPSLLAAKVLPAAAGGFQSAVSTQQYTLQNSDGATWQTVDATNLEFTINPAADEDVVLSANADLWTWNAGYNQDIGIAVTGGTFPTSTGQPEAWKESGGFAGTFSPNAAFAQTVVHLAMGHTYTVRLVWKTNKSASGAQISMGAGPISAAFSPTRITGWVLPSGANTWSSVASTHQYQLAGSDGTTWVAPDTARLQATLTPGADEDTLVSANVDLFTSAAGINQDVAVFVTDNGGAATLIAWKESGGYGGTFSPNAAFVQGAYHMVSGHTYVFTVEWKANKPAGGSTIWAGAGPINTAFSPTRLAIVPA